MIQSDQATCKLPEASGDEISSLGAELHSDEGVETFWIRFDSLRFYHLVPGLIIARVARS